MSFPPTLKYGTLRFIKELGQGAQGMVGEYRDDEEKKSYAVKIDKQQMFTKGALAEGRFLANFGKLLTRAPKYVEHLSQDYVYYLVMEKLEETAEEYIQRKKREGKFDEAIQDIAQQMLEAIEELHKSKHIHRDIKPSNFMMLKDRLYITDFGMHQMYTYEGIHITEQTGLGFTGSPYYASLGSHNGNSLSRRDDLMMLGFSLLHLIVGDGNFWFKNYKDHNNVQIQQSIYHQKLALLHESSEGIKQTSVYQFLKQVEKLRFDEEPDYQLFQQFFTNGFSFGYAMHDMASRVVDNIQYQVIWNLLSTSINEVNDMMDKISK
ncbi:hypothetical protein FGO68_gene12745 [Halteria grandinella]|uniref:Casein kinase I n=1 Tax=Halteria grandinella TaxID=5974 RepID=A0A8J8T2I1_HALGN|nr:hypothetical protein FGO68_gene12745 [Halteria grandinella]